MAEWVATHNCFDVCAQETGYEGGERLRVPWWRQKVAEDQLRVTLEEILEAARVWRQQEYGRIDGIEGGLEWLRTDHE